MEAGQCRTPSQLYLPRRLLFAAKGCRTADCFLRTSTMPEMCGMLWHLQSPKQIADTAAQLRQDLPTLPTDVDIQMPDVQQ